MKTKIFLLSFIILFIAGCEATKKLTQFNMEFNNTIVISSTTGVDLPFNIYTPDIETNAESTFEINDTRKDLVEEIRLTSLTFTLTSPPNADFNFLKSINIFISAEGLSEAKVAWKDDIPSDVSHINLEVTGVDLQEYIKKDEFSLRYNIETNELLASDHHIDVHSVFFVQAKIL